MMTLVLLLVFFAFGALVWFHGLWGAAITLINLTVSMLIATNLYEPICDLIDSLEGGSFTYVLDFVMIWLLFFITFGILRVITDLLSRTRVKFDLIVEMAGRSILAIWCGWLMVSFTAFTLLVAPLNNPDPLGTWSTPAAGSFLGMSPERSWLGFVHSRSRGALARGNFSGTSHADDENLNVEAFDPLGEFPIKAHARRVQYAEEEQMRVAQ